MISLRCTVRGCGAPLRRDGGRFLDAAGHSFDVAKSGYVNLLQPQDRRSSHPGDPDAAVDARRRLFDAGAGAALIEALTATIAGLDLPAPARALDIGSGEGSILGALSARFGLDAAGVELSAHAAGLSARRFPGVLWIVANADRALPFPDASLELVLSISGRRNPAECFRVLAPDGRLVVALPAPDDLAELRGAVLGEAVQHDRTEKLVREHVPHFVPVSRATARERRNFSAAHLADLLAATYRGGRAGRRERAAALDGLEVTLSHDIVVFAASSSH